MCEQDGLLFPQIWGFGTSSWYGRTIWSRSKDGGRGRHDLVTEASRLLKGSRCFGGCRLEQCYLHNAILGPAQHQVSGDLAST